MPRTRKTNLYWLSNPCILKSVEVVVCIHNYWYTWSNFVRISVCVCLWGGVLALLSLCELGHVAKMTSSFQLARCYVTFRSTTCRSHFVIGLWALLVNVAHFYITRSTVLTEIFNVIFKMSLIVQWKTI